MKGYMYKQELSECKRPESFATRVLKWRKKHGKKQLYVIYGNYPDSAPVWINETACVVMNMENKLAFYTKLNYWKSSQRSRYVRKIEHSELIAHCEIKKNI